MLNELLERFRQHDRLALARLLSLLTRGDKAEEIVAQLPPAAKLSRVVAITGSAGVGKSTLVGKLIELIRQEGKTVAVLACDPQSPVSGGALLGDRFRMPVQPDDGVFIRSLAAAGGLGAVAAHLDAMIQLLKSFGFDVILIETVGAGQGDTTVRGLADVVVLLLQPETGDDLQWEKAGVLEVADVIVVQKADLPGADFVEAQVRTTLSLSNGPAAPVLRVSAKTGEGLDQLWRTIEDCSSRRPRHTSAGNHERSRLAEAVLHGVLTRARANQTVRVERILTGYADGDLGAREAAQQLLTLLDARPAQ